MAERKIIAGPDRAPSFVYKQIMPVDTSSAEQQLAALRAPEIYKPVATGSSIYETHPGFPKLGIARSVTKHLYFAENEWSRGQVPLNEASADVTGLKISYDGVVEGLSGQEHVVTLSGSQTAVEAYGKYFKVSPREKEKPSNISDFLPRNVRRLVVA
jgi:hypothetical protein